MKSTFEQKSIEQQVIDSLDAANEGLPTAVQHDIALARQHALIQAKYQQQKPRYRARWWQYAVPTVFAVTLTLLVSYQHSDSVPVMPLEMMSADVPAEDISLLEDLEFAAWLATQDMPLDEEAVL